MNEFRHMFSYVTQVRLWKALALLIDSTLGGSAMYLAVWYRHALDKGAQDPVFGLQIAGVFAASAAVAFYLMGVHRNVWRYSGLPELWRITQAIALTHLLFAPLLFLFNRGEGFSRAALFIEAPIFAGLAIGLRVIIARITAQSGGLTLSEADLCKPATLLVGSSMDAAAALAAAQSTARDRNGRLPRIAGIVATDNQHVGRTIAGVRILGGISEIDAIVEAQRRDDGSPPHIAFAGPLTDRKIIDAALAAAGKVRATVYRFSPGDSAAFLQPVAPADLLTRPPREIQSSAARNLLENKRVLVTGAGGSIGSELCRQIALAGPAKLILFEASERNLYEIDMELSERFPKLRRIAAFGDVRDSKRVEEIFAEHRPDVVMHAAALKHVPLMEMNPNEAILTNLCGVKIIADAAAQWNCGAFVFISTDKAVNPSNVMGATKRAGEIYVRAMAEAFPKTAWAAVRFGNVLGSAGSVLPLFERQISQGGPLTVTDPDITRYFMTVEEASRLVIAAGAHAQWSQIHAGKGLRGGEVYVLDMGDPVRIVDLAQQIIRLKGLEPGRDVQIEFTGLRPGEKLHEEIFYSAESVRDSGVNGVMIAAAAGRPKADLDALVCKCSDAAKQRDTQTALAILASIASDPADAGALKTETETASVKY